MYSHTSQAYNKILARAHIHTHTHTHTHIYIYTLNNKCMNYMHIKWSV